jgi:tRNA A-37 threonylcarbamoyl transferase component Bud32
MKKGVSTPKKANDDGVGVLYVSVMSASNLAAAGDKSTSAPYAVVTSSLNSKQRYKTTVQKKTTEPVWAANQFKFYTSQALNGQTVTVEVWHRGRWTRDVLLGEVKIDLVILKESNIIVNNYELTKEPKGKKTAGVGTVKVKLEYPSGAAEQKPAEAAPPPKEKKSIKEEYDFGEELGRGGFSVVVKATRKDTKEVVAVKIIEKNQSDEELQLLQREIDILKKLTHQNIISLKDVYDEKETIYLVMELVQGGELFDQIVSRGTYSEADAANIVRQILDAVAYMHDNGIAHRDLKPENLLCSGDEHNTIKVTDFGLSKDFSTASLRTSCGTPDYVAPEVLKGQPYDNTVDIWSIGVITYILLCGFPPFYGNTDQQIFEKILRVEYDFPSPDWDHISVEAKQFIKSILVPEPSKRPSALEAMEMDWIKNKAPNKPLERLEFFKAGISKYNLQYQETKRKNANPS